MMGTINCVYETPCHWCSKWDKKCDCKIGKYINDDPTNCRHEWQPTNSGGGRAGLDGTKTYTTYICRLCGATKNIDN